MTTRYCKDCKHFYAFQYVQDKHPICVRPIGTKTDVVWGTRQISDTRGIVEIREDEASCGPSARFFEDKDAQKQAATAITYERVPVGVWWKFWA